MLKMLILCYKDVEDYYYGFKITRSFILHKTGSPSGRGRTRQQTLGLAGPSRRILSSLDTSSSSVRSEWGFQTKEAVVVNGGRGPLRWQPICRRLRRRQREVVVFSEVVLQRPPPKLLRPHQGRAHEPVALDYDDRQWAFWPPPESGNARTAAAAASPCSATTSAATSRGQGRVGAAVVGGLVFQPEDEPAATLRLHSGSLRGRFQAEPGRRTSQVCTSRPESRWVA